MKKGCRLASSRISLQASLKNQILITKFRNSTNSYLLFIERQTSNIQAFLCFFIILTKFCLFGSMSNPLHFLSSSNNRVLLSASPSHAPPVKFLHASAKHDIKWNVTPHLLSFVFYFLLWLICALVVGCITVHAFNVSSTISYLSGSIVLYHK